MSGHRCCAHRQEGRQQTNRNKEIIGYMLLFSFSSPFTFFLFPLPRFLPSALPLTNKSNKVEISLISTGTNLMKSTRLNHTC